MTIVRSPDGSLLLMSPAPPQRHTVEEMGELGGVVKFVLFTSTFHDSHAKRWLARFPDAKLLAPSAALPFLKGANPTVVACERELREAYGITCHDVSPLVRDPCNESIIEIPLKEGGCALHFSDVLQNSSSWASLLFLLPLGWGNGLRLARFYLLAMVRSYSDLEAFLSHIARRRGLRMALFAHGPPLRGDDLTQRLQDAISTHLDGKLHW
mmetsp:Transcript_3386/g.8580  ORF Transcript_3386/g.8580 Transcript_3386/m.8580 type:complete len:211 (+) Transcript_3386:306-938(+)